MIKLNKVVLINWMYFQKATLNINGNTALVGINGTGKSTLIDAIQMLLLGQQQAKFNANANAEKRTLESYVRGEVRVDGEPFLRNGDVITYLALEIISNGTKHVFGINVNYRSTLSKLDDPRYFYVKDLDLTEELFINDKFPKSYDVLIKELKASYEFFPFPTLYAYKFKLKDILGLKDETTYFKALSRAVGLKNITDCNKFINDFVLDAKPIDVSTIKSNIDEMGKVSKTIENEEKKLNALTEIVDKGISVDNSIKELDKTSIKIDLANIKLSNEEILDLYTQNDTSSSKIIDFENQKRIIENEQTNLQNEIIELGKALEKISPNLPKMKKELEDKRKEYNKVHLTLNTFNTNCKTELASLSVLSRYKNDCFNKFYEFLKKGEFTSETTKKQFYDFRNETYKIIDGLKEEASKVKNELISIRDSLVELEDIIKKLENNQVKYSSTYTTIIDFIRTGLKNKFNTDIDVKFLCEYLDITDDSWRNAIEGYLGNQRFYIVVPNEYYKEAMKLYHSNKDIFQTKIINGTRLPEFDLEKGSLGEFVKASNSIALNYVRYLLNRVYCAKDIYELDHYDISVTKDCMLYQNYALGRINPRNYQEQYIGQEGRRIQLEYRKKQKKELDANAFKVKARYQKLQEDIRLVENERIFATNMIEDNSFFESVDKDYMLFDEVNNLDASIKFFEQNPEYIETSAKIAEVEEQKQTNVNKIRDIDKLIIDEHATIKSNEDKINNLNASISYHKEQLVKFDENFVELLSEEINNSKITKVFISRLESDKFNLNKTITRAQVDIENLMRNVRDNFSLNVEPKYESMPRFVEEKGKIDQSMFKYKSKLLEIQKSIRKLFFNTFLTGLYKSIEAAEKTIKNLNYSLATFNFGSDYYKIKMDVTSNQDFKTIYNYAKEYNSDDSERGLFIDREQEDRQRNKILDLLNQYMYSDDQANRDNIVDYRKYLYFDVEVETPNGTKRLNDVIKTQSGGEVQVPFYILAGVAFQQTLDYKRKGKDNVLGIVLYDEAFDKMDSQRIQSMLQFYKDKLDLQVILAAPGKLDSLANNIETFIAVIRDGNNAIVSDISHEI